MRSDEAVAAANRILKKYGTRNADTLVKELGIYVKPCAFKTQKGVYKVIGHDRYIFIKEDLHPVMRSIVLLHEIGHDTLHRKESVSAGGFREFNIFDMQDKRMEYEANIFAAQISLPDDELLELIYNGYDIAQVAKAMHSDINLVALKVAELNRCGYALRQQEHNNKFLSGK